jgi:hypothetical protein
MKYKRRLIDAFCILTMTPQITQERPDRRIP